MYHRIAIFLAALAAAEALHLPKYITRCTAGDPEFRKCAIDSANKAIPHLANGDRQFHTPSVDPLKLPLIDIHASQNLNVKLTDCTLEGLETMIVKDIDLDFEKKHGRVVVFSHHIVLLADYEISGKVLVLPIQGKGPANITCVDSTFDYIFDYELVDKKGEQYLELVNPKIEYDIQRSYYHFENLFNGDKNLGDQMNKFLNENHQEVSKDLGPTISETIDSIVTAILKAFLEKVSYNELFNVPVKQK